MAGEVVTPIRDIPGTGTPAPDVKLALDNGVSMFPASLSEIADAVRPVASDSDARAGIDTTKSMSPASTSSAIIAQVYPTRSDLSSTNLPPNQDRVTTSGRDVPGLGGAEYVEVFSPPSPGGFSTPDGRMWDLASQTYRLSMFGAVCFSHAEILAAAGAGMSEAANRNDLAFAAAISFASSIGGADIILEEGIYPASKRINLASCVRLIGAGSDKWDPIIVVDNPKGWKGTHILFRGTGTKDISFWGITSQETRGGWVPDPNDAGHFLKQWTAYNRDATTNTPATNKLFSAAVMVPEFSTYSGMQGIRVAPWIGADGISEYDWPANDNLGADWDFGVLILNSSNNRFYEAQAVGYWRESGFATIGTARHQPGSEARRSNERNHLLRCSGQGKIGRLIRATDKWPVVSWTSSTITIPWDAEFPFPQAWSLETQGLGRRAYTSWSASGGLATFEMVDAVGANPVEVRPGNNGLSGSMDEDSYFYPLCHTSNSLGPSAEDFGIQDSKALEVSGWPLRAHNFLNTKYHGYERTLSTIGQCYDFDFIGCQFEAAGKYILAMPADIHQTWALYPSGETRSLTMSGPNNLNECNLSLFMPRNGFVESLQNRLRDWLFPDLILRPLRSGFDTIIQSFAGNGLFRIGDSRARFYQNATDTPGQGNATVGASLRSTGDFFLSSSGVGINLNRTGTGALANLRTAGVLRGQISATDTYVGVQAESGHEVQLRVASSVRVRADGAGATMLLKGPYANDAAAASAGILTGEIYRQTGGSVVWRQT